jgi:hypothetical protein
MLPDHLIGLSDLQIDFSQPAAQIPVVLFVGRLFRGTWRLMDPLRLEVVMRPGRFVTLKLLDQSNLLAD